mmetsp:Transcript_16708/g.18098  ORF Transcript_16708/g.18098 Transcript_16708/m.18098 type:complete len:489 (-) Transcript_16708:139-1605(-)
MFEENQSIEVSNLYFVNSDPGTFLAELSRLIPELLLYRSTCCFSPDVTGKVTQPNKILVEAVFGTNTVQEWFAEDQETAWLKIGEINKIFLRLIYLRSFIQADKSLFSSVGEKEFLEFSGLIQSLCQNKDLLFFTTLSIIFDALGRTKDIRDLVDSLDDNIENSNSTKDHEEYWRIFLQATPEIQESAFYQILPSFQALPYEQMTLYANQVMKNSFNLSAFVQGESVPYSLYELAFSTDGNFLHRIIVLLLTFISFRYNNNFEAVGYTNSTHDQFCGAVKALISEATPFVGMSSSTLKYSCFHIYETYLTNRLSVPGVPRDALMSYTGEERYTIARIFALSRSSNDKHLEKIIYVWDSLLSKRLRGKLTYYMTVTGLEDKKAIYVYYAPAIFANTITIAKKIEEFRIEQNDVEDFDRDGWTVGLFYALNQLVGIYEYVAKNQLLEEGEIISEHGAGIYLYNATIEAKGILEEENAKYHQKVMKQLMHQ